MKLVKIIRKTIVKIIMIGVRSSETEAISDQMKGEGW
jgi:hypothetical protein